jgi:ABC-type branched-subunit amino acid transport system ATPase component
MRARDAGARPAGRPAPLFLATLPGHEVRCDAGQVVAVPDDEPLVRALTGERRPSGTRILLAGHRLDRLGPATRVRRGLAVVRGTEVADDVSVHDHLAATVGGRAARALLAAAPLLAHRGDDPAGVLSGGERRVLGWLQAQAAQPRAVLLDRAGTGLDATALRWAHEAVDRWLAGGTAVLVRPGRGEELAWLTRRADGRPRAANGRV